MVWVSKCSSFWGRNWYSLCRWIGPPRHNNPPPPPLKQSLIKSKQAWSPCVNTRPAPSVSNGRSKTQNSQPGDTVPINADIYYKPKTLLPFSKSLRFRVPTVSELEWWKKREITLIHKSADSQNCWFFFCLRHRNFFLRIELPTTYFNRKLIFF